MPVQRRRDCRDTRAARPSAAVLNNVTITAMYRPRLLTWLIGPSSSRDSEARCGSRFNTRTQAGAHRAAGAALWAFRLRAGRDSDCRVQPR